MRRRAGPDRPPDGGGGAAGPVGLFDGYLITRWAGRRGVSAHRQFSASKKRHAAPPGREFWFPASPRSAGGDRALPPCWPAHARGRIGTFVSPAAGDRAEAIDPESKAADEHGERAACLAAMLLDAVDAYHRAQQGDDTRPSRRCRSGAARAMVRGQPAAAAGVRRACRKGDAGDRSGITEKPAPACSGVALSMRNLAWCWCFHPRCYPVRNRHRPGWRIPGAAVVLSLNRSRDQYARRVNCGFWRPAKSPNDLRRLAGMKRWYRGGIGCWHVALLPGSAG